MVVGLRHPLPHLRWVMVCLGWIERVCMIWGVFFGGGGGRWRGTIIVCLVDGRTRGKSVLDRVWMHLWGNRERQVTSCLGEDRASAAATAQQADCLVGKSVERISAIPAA